MDDYEFSTRLKFFLNKKDISREKFYYDYLQNEIEKRTYDSYFSNGVNKRYPNKNRAKLIAIKLDVEPWLLTPHTKDFEEKIKRIVRMLGITEEEFQEHGFILNDYEQAEYEILKIKHHLFNDILFDKSNNISNKMRNILLLIVQYFLDVDEPFISESILEIIIYVSHMDTDEKKKFYQYINLMIAGLHMDGWDEVFSYPMRYEELCKMYSLSLTSLNNRYWTKIGNVNLKKLKQKIDEKGTGNNSFNNLKDILIFLSNSDMEYVDILLKCILLRDSLLDSLAIIVKPLYYERIELQITR